MHMGKFRKHLSGLLMSIYPILALYKLNEMLTIGDIILVVLMVLTIVSGKFVIERKFFFLMIALALLNYINGLISGDLTSVANNSLAILKFGVLLSILLHSKIFELDIFYKYCKFVAVISIIFLAYQVAIYNIQGAIISGKIFEAELIHNVLKSENWGRFSSFFGEPAHMAIYLAPVLAVSLIKEKYFISMIISLGMLLTTSSSGVIFIAILLLHKYFSNKETYNVKNIISAIILFIVFYLGYQLMTIYYYDNYVNKFTMEYFTGNIRLFGSIEYLKHLNFYEWILGIGINKLSTFGQAHSFLAANYSNSFIYSIISFGLVGSFFLFKWIWDKKKRMDLRYKSIFIILILILLSDQVLFNWNLMYILIWLGISLKNDVNFKEFKYKKKH